MARWHGGTNRLWGMHGLLARGPTDEREKKRVVQCPMVCPRLHSASANSDCRTSTRRGLIPLSLSLSVTLLPISQRLCIIFISFGRRRLCRKPIAVDIDMLISTSKQPLPPQAPVLQHYAPPPPPPPPLPRAASGKKNADTHMSRKNIKQKKFIFHCLAPTSSPHSHPPSRLLLCPTLRYK